MGINSHQFGNSVNEMGMNLGINLGKWPIEIDGLPFLKFGLFHGKLLNHQMVIWGLIWGLLALIEIDGLPIYRWLIWGLFGDFIGDNHYMGIITIWG